MVQTGFNPLTFSNQFKTRGYAKPNLFLARIPMPRGLAGGVYDANVKDAQFWCEGANLPGIMLGTYDANRYSYGAREKRPVTPIVQDTAFTFFADAGSEVAGTQNPTIGTYYDFFTNWIRLIDNFDMHNGIRRQGTNLPNITYEVSYKIDYVSNIEIYVFNEMGKVAYSVTLRDAFPLMVNDTRLNWGDTSGVLRIQTIFTYTDWFVNDVVDTDITPSPQAGQPVPNPPQMK